MVLGGLRKSGTVTVPLEVETRRTRVDLKNAARNINLRCVGAGWNDVAWFSPEVKEARTSFGALVVDSWVNAPSVVFAIEAVLPLGIP